MNAFSFKFLNNAYSFKYHDQGPVMISFLRYTNIISHFELVEGFANSSKGNTTLDLDLARMSDSIRHVYYR